MMKHIKNPLACGSGAAGCVPPHTHGDVLSNLRNHSQHALLAEFILSGGSRVGYNLDLDGQGRMKRRNQESQALPILISREGPRRTRTKALNNCLLNTYLVPSTAVGIQGNREIAEVDLNRPSCPLIHRRWAVSHHQRGELLRALSWSWRKG